MNLKRLMVAAVLCNATAVAAVCTEGHPDVAVEFGRSDDVVDVRITDVQTIMDERAPGFVSRYRYTGLILRSFKGRAAGVAIYLYDDNTSSRFPMDAGSEYRVFVKRWADGDGIDSCGNSRLLDDASNMLGSPPGAAH